MKLLINAGYSKKAIEFYTNKINVGTIENADSVLAYKGLCGDICKIYLKIIDKNVIETAKFQYLGCPASAACGSIVT
jgi:NifU-like protein involved in Fe-S cluster formation